MIGIEVEMLGLLGITSCRYRHTPHLNGRRFNEWTLLFAPLLVLI